MNPDFIDAIASRDIGSARRALEIGDATANDRDPHGKPVLQVALDAGQLEAVRLLLRHGADPCAPDGGSQSAGPFTVLDGAVADADLSGEFSRLQLLLDAGMDINIRQNGMTLLIQAIAGCFDIDLLRFLLGRGADPNIPGPNRCTALMYAADPEATALSCGQAEEAVQLLMAHGADVTAKNDLGYTALDILRNRSSPKNYASVKVALENAINRH